MKRLIKLLLIVGFGVFIGLFIGFIAGARWGGNKASMSLSLFNATPRAISSVRYLQSSGDEPDEKADKDTEPDNQK